MTFGVFIHRQDSIYDDSPSERYQFPKQYLGRVKACVGSWIIYYEPTKVTESRGYFATAKVKMIIPDPKINGMFLAIMEPGTYIDFVRPVAFQEYGSVVEKGLLNNGGRLSGRAQAAVRSLTSIDFRTITEFGFDENGKEALPRDILQNSLDGFHENQTPFDNNAPRDHVQLLSNRAVRDRLFRHNILTAYDKRCAVTGLKLINGGGRAEVQAAHIKPVSANGPDSIINGIALSGTAHWMFDRGLLTLSDDYEILVSRQVNDPDSIRAIVNQTGRAKVPKNFHLQPHPMFLDWHRTNCFKR